MITSNKERGQVRRPHTVDRRLRSSGGWDDPDNCVAHARDSADCVRAGEHHRGDGKYGLRYVVSRQLFVLVNGLKLRIACVPYREQR